MKTIQTITAVLSLLLATGTGKIHNNEINPGTAKSVITINHESIADEKQPDYFNAFCTTPARPGSITGSPIACYRLTTNYSISPVPGATSYTWTVIGGPIIGASNGTKISVRWGWSAKSLSVRAVNSCGTSYSSTLTITHVVDCSIH